MSFRKRKVDIITMGCSKNLIDSERLIHQLNKIGFDVEHNPENPNGEYVIVNTCGFIGDAKEESINMILQLAELKRKNKIGKLIIMGCLSERYRKDLPAELPEVDNWYGKFDWTEIIDQLSENSHNKNREYSWERKLTTPPWSAYVKVSEGCNRFCAFCAIPLITGRHKSRKIEDIVEEVKHLASQGVKEFNIIAQDLSSYGTDLYGKQTLPELVEKLSGIEGVEWIRLHYLYPADFPLDLLDVMNRHDNVCKYLDIALQHISDGVLKGMKRHISKEETLKLLATIRERVPGIHIRTTVMTGFPGEDEAAFRELVEFVETQKFERLGGFAYCEEEDTAASKLYEDAVPSEVKKERLDEIMQIQQEISLESNNSKIGKTMRVLIEENNGGEAVGRTEFDSPEVDQEVYISNCSVEPGNFADVEIVGADEYSLAGKLKS